MTRIASKMSRPEREGERCEKGGRDEGKRVEGKEVREEG